VFTTYDDREEMMRKTPPPVKRAVRTAAPPARRRRTADETRRILLDAATRVAISQMSPLGNGVSNLLAGVRITDALAEVNANHGLATKMTTGAAYHIWPDQAAFQLELLEHVMNAISIPGADEIERSVTKMIAAGAPADEIFAMVADADFEATIASPELFLALGLGALAPADLVNQAQALANATYIASVGRLLTPLLHYAGRRLRPGRTLEDLIWATEAVAVGYLLRWRTHPQIPTAIDRNARTARATAYLGMIHAFTEPTHA
jgi:hypothetical protein